MTGKQSICVFAVVAALGASGAVRINEIMASNGETLKTAAGGEGFDWVELYNDGAEDVDVKGWILFDDPTKKTSKWEKIDSAGETVIVPAGGYRIIWVDKDYEGFTTDEAYSRIGLSTDGEPLFLATAADAAAIVDECTFPAQIKDISYGPGGAYYKTPTPGAANAAEVFSGPSPEVTFSEPHGFKTAPVSVALACAEEGVDIYYTLDGTEPTSANGTKYDGTPIVVSQTTCLRASAAKPDSVLNSIATATYLFVEDIVRQGSSVPAGFPASGAVNGQAMEYGFNASAMTKYGADVRLALSNSVPAYSLVFDPKSLFDKKTGIYVNAWNDGKEWERRISVELIDPTGGEEGFTTPAGLRIRGGTSRQATNPKHSLRLFFRSEYGAGKLKYALFGKEGAKSFDKVDLRTAQNHSWSLANCSWNTFVHEVFSRDSQRDQGQPYTRSRFCHLYLNGQYWGLYQTEERADEDFAETYEKTVAGKDSSASNYDVIKTMRDGSDYYELEASAGTFEAWDAMIALVNQTCDDAMYQRLRGRNADGTENPEYPVYLDDENLMAYMLNTHYANDSDAPWNGKVVNNMYALRDRTDRRGFIWIRHDSEHTMAIRYKVEGAAYNPANSRLDVVAKNTFTRADFNPAGLHWKLMNGSALYRAKYEDMLQRELLHPGGAFTEAAAKARFRARMAEIDTAIHCEAARWGRNRNDRTSWLKACDYVLGTYIPARAAQMIGFHRNHTNTCPWFPLVDAPSASVWDATDLRYGAFVALAAPAGTTLYWTDDGSDPRADDGSPAATASSDGEVVVRVASCVVKMRAYSPSTGEWSALETTALGLKTMPEAVAEEVSLACSAPGVKSESVVVTATVGGYERLGTNGTVSVRVTAYDAAGVAAASGSAAVEADGDYAIYLGGLKAGALYRFETELVTSESAPTEIARTVATSTLLASVGTRWIDETAANVTNGSAGGTWTYDEERSVKVFEPTNATVAATASVLETTIDFAGPNEADVVRIPDDARAAVRVVEDDDGFRFAVKAGACWQTNSLVNAKLGVASRVRITFDETGGVLYELEEEGGWTALGGGRVAAEAVLPQRIGYLGSGAFDTLQGDVCTVAPAEDLPAIDPAQPGAEQEIANALSDAADPLVRANVKTAAEYGDLCGWAAAKGVSPSALIGSRYAYLAFATGANGLLDPAAVESVDKDDVKIKAPVFEDGTVTLHVKVESLPVAPDAKAAYLAKIFGLTGGEEPTGLKPENVRYLEAVMPDNDDGVLFKAAPTEKVGTPDCFFYRAYLDF